MEKDIKVEPRGAVRGTMGDYAEEEPALKGRVEELEWRGRIAVLLAQKNQLEEDLAKLDLGYIYIYVYIYM